MQFVDTVHCPDTKYVKVGLKCLKHSMSEPNHLKVCHEFAPGQKCSVPQRRQRFCIDTYEYPNKKGGHPPVMVSAYDAAAMCKEQGKRLCYESEWTAACEGPDKLPFPYGLKRQRENLAKGQKGCNINNTYKHPNLEKVHAKSDRVRGPELTRIDQSVRSGAMKSCKSGFGVHDLTGNFDEWVATERRRGKSKWAGLKGGAWGFVRNACRPITTSHVAHWSYYFISFRCCADPKPEALTAPPKDGIPVWTPPRFEAPPHPGRKPLDRGYTPGQAPKK